MSVPTLSVSIVTYNSSRCLASLKQSIASQQNIHFELFLVDNASSYNTAALLSQWPEAHITLNPTNVGFGRAHNQNRPHFRGRHLLFLNPDLTFDEHLFAHLCDFLDAHPDVGIVGPELFEGQDHSLFPPRKFYPGEAMSPLEPSLDREDIAWISGACFAIRRDLFEQLDGFDPSFFLYQEETDLCLRARRAGYRIGWCQEVMAVHLGRDSTHRQSEYARDLKLFEGTLHFWAKHYPPKMLSAMVRWNVTASAILLRLGIARNDPHFEPDRLRARHDVCAAWLRQQHLSAWPQPLPFMKILLRHCAIAWYSLTTARMPLDDY